MRVILLALLLCASTSQATTVSADNAGDVDPFQWEIRHLYEVNDKQELANEEAWNSNFVVDLAKLWGANRANQQLLIKGLERMFAQKKEAQGDPLKEFLYKFFYKHDREKLMMDRYWVEGAARWVKSKKEGIQLLHQMYKVNLSKEAHAIRHKESMRVRMLTSIWHTEKAHADVLRDATRELDQIKALHPSPSGFPLPGEIDPESRTHRGDYKRSCTAFDASCTHYNPVSRAWKCRYKPHLKVLHNKRTCCCSVPIDQIHANNHKLTTGTKYGDDFGPHGRGA